MKLVKLSLAAMIAVGTSAVASDSLAEAFKNGTLKGELKTYYFDRDSGNGASKGDIINVGLNLNYVTGDFYGFKGGMTVQTSNAPWADEEGKTKFKGDMWGSGAVLSEAYLAYTFKKTTFKIGRQYIATPLLKGSGSRFIKQSFEGFTAVSKDIPSTTLMAAYVNKFQNRTDGSGKIADFESLGTDVEYGYSVAAINKSLPGTTITAAYGELDNSYSMLFAEAKYAAKMDKAKYNVALQYSETDYESDATEDASFYGVKLGGGIAGFNAYAAYAEVQDGTSKFGIVGGGRKTMLYTTSVTDAGEYKESEQYAIDANYMFKNLGLKLGARFVDVDYATDEEADWTAVYAAYKFKGALKGLTTSIQFEQKDSSTDSKDKEEIRFRAIYKF